MTEAGVRFCALYGLTIEVRWEGKGIGNEIEHLLASLPLTNPMSVSSPAHIVLKFTTSDSPSNVPFATSEPLFCYDLSIFEADGYVFLTDGQSIFQVQPQAGTGLITLHRSFKEKPLFLSQLREPY